MRAPGSTGNFQQTLCRILPAAAERLVERDEIRFDLRLRLYELRLYLRQLTLRVQDFDEAYETLGVALACKLERAALRRQSLDSTSSPPRGPGIGFASQRSFQSAMEGDTYVECKR